MNSQEHAYGCGISCVAYLLNITYDKARQFFERESGSWDGGYYCNDIITALGKAGLKYRYRQYKIGEKIKPNSIVFIKNIQILSQNINNMINLFHLQIFNLLSVKMEINSKNFNR